MKEMTIYVADDGSRFDDRHNCCIDKLGREWDQPYFVNHPPAEPKERKSKA